MVKLRKPRSLVIGELNVDIVATGLNRLPELGSEVFAGNCELTLGSASAIFASGMSKLGSRVTFVSQVGNDLFGDFCIAALTQAGIEITNVERRPELKTGVTIALSGSKDRALVTYPGAIATMDLNQLELSIMKGHQHLHLTSYYLQKALKPSFPDIFRAARESGLTTSFDPNTDPAGVWKSEIDQVFLETDVLFLNDREALRLTGAASVRSALKSLGKDVRCVVIKKGSAGASAIQDGLVTSEPAVKVKTVDTTGAGDSFDAGFMFGYLRGKTITECLRIGNACGALSTLRPGGTAGQPDLKKLQKFIAQNQGEDES